MFKEFFRRHPRVSPQTAIILLLTAAIGGSGLALFFSRSGPQPDANAVPRVARVERVEGDVDIARSFTDDGAAVSEWDDATLNAPLSTGDRIYARDNSRATIALTGRNFARIDPGTSLDVLSFADDRTQLALRDGSAIFDVGHLEPGELFEVATPHGAVDFHEPGLYQVGFGDDGGTMISVLSGLAQVVGLAGSGQISKGEMLTLLGTVAAQAALSRLSPDLAGGIVDDYYGHRYPDDYDGRYRSYDAYLDDPDYYQPYRRASNRHDSYYDVPGWYDLDDYGDWNDYDGYGRCWSPRVDAGWSPYRDGSWINDDLWGPTWVSNERWGWAPYHYGRWAHVNNSRWIWVPQQVTTYAPALVAFVPLRQTRQVAWVPLAPNEPYIPRTYDAHYQPQYYAAPEVVSRVVNAQRAYANLGVPSAVTAVPFEDFTGVGRARAISYVNPQVLAQSQPVMDPYAIDGLRQYVVKRKNGRYKVKEMPAYAQQAWNTPVVTSAAPIVPRGRPDFAQVFNAQPVPEKVKKRKMKVDDSGQVVLRPDGVSRPPIPQPNASPVAQERGQRIAALRTQVAQGNQAARSELRQLKRQQREEEKTARRAARQQVFTPQAPAQAVPQLQQQQTREQRKARKRLERQQRLEGQPQAQVFEQQRAATAQQREQRRQMKRQAEAQQAAQMQQSREQRKAQKRLERQQRQQPQAQVFEQQRAATAQQHKAQKRAERQQRMMEQQNHQRQQALRMQQAQQSEMERQRRKAERRAARQQQAAPQVRSPQSQGYLGPPIRQDVWEKAQRKAERRAARQQAAQQQIVAPRQVPQRQVPNRVMQSGGAATATPDYDRKAQRKAERAQRRAERGKP